MSTFLNKEIAARAGRISRSRLTPEQRTEVAELGGNTLLRLMGTQYYAALGRRSAQVKAAQGTSKTGK